MKFPKSNSPGAMNLGAFAVVILAGRNLRDFAGLGRTNQVARAAMVIFLISLVGMPPLAYLLGKFLLFGAAIDVGFTSLAVVAILNGILFLAVYLRIVVPMYRAEGGRGVRLVMTAVRTIALAATVAVGLAAQLILGRISGGTRERPPSQRAARRT